MPPAGEPSLSAEETLTLRNRHISDSCRLHFTKSPLKIVKARGQYMWNEYDEKFLDCTSRTSAVGHCHPGIVSVACSQMSKLSILSNCSSNEDYSRLLLSTLPEKFEVCLFTSSGGEANDVALQLARRYTGRKGVAVVDGAFHGAVVSLMDISPKAFRVSPEGKKPWVHVIPCPDWYRGEYQTEEEASEKYFEDAVKVLESARKKGSEIGCFICEPILVVPGVIVPPKGWLKKIYRYIQENGGVVIADEIVTGLGRTGSNFWAFQSLGDGAIPDIVTIGKPLGNGHPIAAVLTTKKVAQVLSEDECLTMYCCGPVENAVGITVLKVLEEERLMVNAVEVGLYFRERLKELQRHHPTIGDIRGLGLLNGVDIVRGNNKVPASDLAERFSYKFKDKGVLVSAEGEFENVLVFIPPFCLTRDDIDQIVQVFDELLFEITSDVDIYSFLGNTAEADFSVIRQESPGSSTSRTSLDYNALD